jgi:ubiquitin-protein ligase/Ran GTPase-activating protein (RanGAP) involved in mRNA processing and transport
MERKRRGQNDNDSNPEEAIDAREGRGGRGGRVHRGGRGFSGISSRERRGFSGSSSRGGRGFSGTSYRGGKGSQEIHSSRGGRGGRPEGPSGSVNKRMAKKYQERANLNALLITDKSRSLQRLMRDYKEVMNCTTQYSGVVAHPLEDDFYEWHANIKAKANNPLKGVVAHLKFVFPKNYPSSAPKVYVLNIELNHPSIAPDRSICLDILDLKKDLYKGWNSGFTALSILLQLQIFFFDIEESFFDEKYKKEISEKIRSINEYACGDCKHKGSSNPWPEFIKNDDDPALHTMNQKSYMTTIKNELVCYHTKLSYEETPLGIGINIVKLPRTGEIKGIVSCLDLISLKAYSKEKLRKSMNGDRFTHWFPLYFGINTEQFIHLAKKAISMIVTGTTKNFESSMVIKVIPKFFNLITDIISEKVKTSSESLKILIYIYRASIQLIVEFPTIRDDINAILYKFLNDPASRVKEHTTSLGDLLALIPLSNHKIEEFIPAYVEEQMDRQIFWILSALPNFESLIESSTVDNIRASVCFKAGIVGNQILLFYYYLNKSILFKHDSTIENIAEKLDTCYGNLSNDEISNHQKEIQKILKIDSYKDYYKYLNLPGIDEKELNLKLKNSYKNSFIKGYHGKDEVRFVPNDASQMEMYFSKFPEMGTLIENEMLKPISDPIWEKLVLEKFDFVAKLKYKNASLKLNPYDVIKFYEETKYEYLFLNRSHEFNNKGTIQKHFSINYEFADEEKPYIENLNWRQIYIKLYLELVIKYFRYVADFKLIYTLLEFAKDDISHLNLFIYEVGDLKSDYNYIRIILSKLPKLKYLSLIFNTSANLKLIKNLIKGIGNFNAAGGDLHGLRIYSPNAGSYSQKDMNILTIIDKLPNLKFLDLSDTGLDYNTSLRIRNHLYYFKTIETLNLSNCKLTDEMAKEIADGIMKAKSLEKIYLNNNYFKKGLSSILYNLAFQPSLCVIDISDNKSADLSETCTALYKLIKMSQSLNVLICRGITNLNGSLTNEFYYSLGDNSSLTYLDLSLSGSISCSNITQLGNAIALNCLKKGSLTTLILQNVGNYTNLFEFINGLEINEHIHFTWYGTLYNSNIIKDSKEYYNKTMNCGLKNLDFGNNEMNVNFNINDVKTNHVNILRRLLENTPSLTSISFERSLVNKNFIDLLTNALLNKNNLKSLNLEGSNINGYMVKILMTSFAVDDKQCENNKIELLDLSNNNFGYSGIESISKILSVNKSIRVLNLFHNLFDINGARRLREAIKVNVTLEALDIGYNRIKDRGFGYIIEGLTSNQNNKLTFLGSKYNFVQREGLMINLPLILNNPNSHIDQLEISSNSLDNKTIFEAFNLLGDKQIKIDIFEKLYYYSEERLERSAWISPLTYSDSNKTLYDAIKLAEKEIIEKENSHIGIPLFIGFKRGRKLGEKKGMESLDAFVEFILPNSINRLLKIASTDGIILNNRKLRMYKAGTKPERILVKRKKNI